MRRELPESIVRNSTLRGDIQPMRSRNLLLLTVLFVATLSATAQSNYLVGTWALVAADKILPDGNRVSDHYGDNPHGIAIFTADGHYVIDTFRANHTKFASKNRPQGSPDESKESLEGMSVHFGRYSVDPSMHTISFTIDRASFSDWDETTQVRGYECRGCRRAIGAPGL
jgi:hypothetical protein